MEILCSFKLVLEGKTGKEIPESSRLEFIEKNFSAKFGLVSNLALNATNKFGRKISGRGAVRAGIRFTLFTLNEYVNEMIKIM